MNPKSSKGHLLLMVLAGGLATGAAGFALQTAFSPASPAYAQSPGSVTPAQLTTLRRMRGDFVLATRADTKRLRGLIETATAKVTTAQRRGLRARLEETLSPAPRVKFALDDATVSKARVRVQEGRVAVNTGLSGALQALPADQARGGDRSAMFAQKVQDSALVQTVESGGIRQERRFTLNAAGTSLTLDVRITGGQLAAPVQTSTVYRRL